MSDIWFSSVPHDFNPCFKAKISNCNKRWCMNWSEIPEYKKNKQGDFFAGAPKKVLNTEKLIWARLGVSRAIYVNVYSPNLGFPYFNFLGGHQSKKKLYIMD